MIPILYEKNETEFTSNGLGRLRDCITCKVTEERNGIYECDFEYPVGGQNYDKIKVGRIVAVEHDDSGDVQPFDIMSIQKNIEGMITVHCTHISYRMSYMTVTLKNINSLANALSGLSNAKPSNPFTFWTDKTSAGYLGAGDGIPRSVRSILGGVEGSILDTYGGEYQFDGFVVRLYASRGRQRDFTIRYGLNMTEYEDEVDISECYSSCIPYWTDGTDTIIGNKQTLSGATPSGRDGCIPLDVSDKFEEKPSKAEVNAMGLSVMNSQNPTVPAQNISVQFVRLQDSEEYREFAPLLRCGLCDTIRVIFPDYNSSGYFKIVRAVWDVLGERYEEMELGSLSASLAEALGVSDALDAQRTKETSGSQSANYTSAFTLGDCTILTGNVIVNVTTANSNKDVSVSFGNTFKYDPNVQVTMLNIGGSYYQKCTAAGISTTGFTARVRAGGTPGNINVNWVAIGELA